MPELTHKIEKTEEREFVIDTNDFFRPDLKQIGNSVLDVRNYFCPRDAVQVSLVPEIPQPTLKDIHEDLLFLVENSAFFCQVSVGNCDTPGQHISLKGGLVFLSESITQIINIADVNRPNSVQCDVIVLLPHQPVSVLTVVDGNIKSEIAVKYNVSIARGVTVALAKFMNECTSPLFGVLDRTVLKFQNSFEAHIKSLKQCSVLFVTPTSLSMSPMKYDKVQTAFWASVAETTAVTDDAGNDYLRFLTKDQCILLLENIGKQEVIVKCEPGCGGSTLMLEVSKRLSRTGETVIVCDDEEERKRFRKANVSTFSYDELRDLPKSSIQHVVHGGGELSFIPHGTVWKFVRTETSEASCQKAMMEETESQSKDSKLENTELLKKIRPHQDLIKEFLATTGKERFEELQNTLVETKKFGHLEEYPPVDDFEEKLVQLLLDIATLQFSTKDLHTLKAPSLEPEDIYVFPVQHEKENPVPKGDSCSDQKQNSRGSLYPNVTEAVKALQEDPELFHSIRQDIVNDNRNISYLEEKVAYLKKVVTVPNLRVDLRTEERREDDQKALARDPGEVKKDVQSEITITQRGEDSRVSSHQVYQLRRFQYGNTKQGEMFSILGNVIRDKAIRLPSLQAESDTLEKGFGCPVYIVGEAGSPKSRPLSCPQLDLDKDRVNTEVTHISDNDELVNLPAAISDQSKLSFKRYRGTCTSTSIPLPSPYTRFPPCPRYWETRVRGLVKREVPVWRILFDVGVSEESQLDLKYMQSAQSRSWCFVLADCGMHEGICTKVWAEGALVKCIRNTMTNAPNSYSVHNYGTVLDVWRGRLAFIDLNSEAIIHQFDIDFTEDLYPMIGTWLYPEDYTVCMKWVCGKDISMSDKKKSLIHKALYTQNEQ